jgi:hypothetical protein
MKTLVQKPQFVLCPPFLKEALAKGYLVPSDLNQFKKLVSILSVEQVKKFLFLNQNEFKPSTAAYTYANAYVVKLLALLQAHYPCKEFLAPAPEWLKEHPVNPVGSVEEALCDGLDTKAQIKLLEAMPQNYHQGFDIITVDANTYAVILTEMQLLEASGDTVMAQEHLKCFQKDMRQLLDSIGCHYPDEFMVKSDLYSLYVGSM